MLTRIRRAAKIRVRAAKVVGRAIKKSRTREQAKEPNQSEIATERT